MDGGLNLKKYLLKETKKTSTKDLLSGGKDLEWYAARVMTGDEYLIKKRLNRVYPDCVVYIPRLMSTDVKDNEVIQKTEKMLPGYVLLGSHSKISVGSMQENIEIIGRVSWSEVEEIKCQEYVGPIEIDSGTKVIITEGPFMGCKGCVQGDSACGKKVKVRIRFNEIECNPEINKEYVSGIK